MTPARARSVHLVVAAVAWFALAFQLVLVVSGEAILVEDDPPGLVARVYRFFAYFTIQSNALVALTTTVGGRGPPGGPARGGAPWGPPHATARWSWWP